MRRDKLEAIPVSGSAGCMRGAWLGGLDAVGSCVKCQGSSLIRLLVPIVSLVGRAIVCLPSALAYS